MNDDDVTRGWRKEPSRLERVVSLAAYIAATIGFTVLLHHCIT